MRSRMTTAAGFLVGLTRALTPSFVRLPRGGVSLAASATTTTTLATMTAPERLASLRSRMEELGLDVYLVPTDDPHLSGK